MLRAGGSELALVSKLKTLHDDNQRFFVPDKFSSNKFGVRHYAEPVSYTVDGLSLIHISEPTRPY